MKKTRKITKTEEYEVCDICGLEIVECNGNTFLTGKDAEQKQYTIHLMDAFSDGCVHDLILKALKK